MTKQSILSENVESPLSLKAKISLALIDGLTLPLAWLPSRLGLAFGAAGGRLAYRVLGKRRKIAQANLEMIKANGSLPADLDVNATAREAFANMGRSAWEAICFYHRGLRPFLPYCRVEEGREYLEEVLNDCRQSGRSLLIVTGHMGNWELMCQYTSQAFDFLLHIVGRNSGKTVADAWAEKLRTKIGNKFIAKKGGARDMIKVLRQGGVLGTLIDQAVIGNHVGAPVPFLGRVATTNLGPLRLARRGDSHIIMTLFRREGRYNYVKILPPLAPRENPDDEESLIADATQLNHCLGEHIRRYPDQWMWGHRRWKTREKVAEDADSIV